MTKEVSKRALGIFDSGVGGLTVVNALKKELPFENIIYFGDTARVPYGSKSGCTIIRYSLENTLFLLEHQIKMLIVACNTASAYAVEKLRTTFLLPIVDMITPAVEKALQVSKGKRIAVLGTKGTIASEAYQKAFFARSPDINIFPIASPLLVPLIEEGYQHHPITKIALKEYLEPIKRLKIDTLLLGCTHYPLLMQEIQEVVGEQVTLVDSASACVTHVKKQLDQHKLGVAHQNDPNHQFFVSDDPDTFDRLGAHFFPSSCFSKATLRSISN